MSTYLALAEEGLVGFYTLVVGQVEPEGAPARVLRFHVAVTDVPCS